jgi:hypothetical protein
MENLVGQIVEVIVSKNGKVASKNLKVCKVNSRSVLFIEVDKINRKNTFRKFKVKNVEKVGTKTDGGTFVLIEDAIMPDKWESSWDSIGSNPTPSYARPFYSRRSQGWAPKLPSTTNSAAGFPMV